VLGIHHENHATQNPASNISAAGRTRPEYDYLPLRSLHGCRRSRGRRRGSVIFPAAG
jgi:hypothetical protein